MQSLFIAIFLFAIFLPIVALAQIPLNLDYPDFGPFNPETDQDFGQIIGYLYYLIIGIAGLAAFVMLVWGGVQWLVSGAIPAQAAEARDKVRNAILGLLLVLASFLIVQVINPELTIMRGVSLEGECRHEDPDDPSSPCAELTATIRHPGGDLSLKADGEEDLLITTSGNVTLEWVVSGVQDNCQGNSTPDTTLWNGLKDKGGGTETVPVPTGTFTFVLTCFKGVETSSDQVVVNTSGVPPGPQPVTDLRVEKTDGTLSDGPHDLPGPDLPASGIINFTLDPSSQNIDVCTGVIETVLRISGQVIDQELWFFEEPPPAPGDWWQAFLDPPITDDQLHFKVTCYNPSRTASDEDDPIILQQISP